MTKALFNWSAGKDSSLALYRILQEGRYEITGLLTNFNNANDRVSMHGISRELIENQAQQIGQKLYPLMLPEHIGMEEYNEFMQQSMIEHKKRGVTTCIFGDIFLEDLKTYREQQLQKLQVQAFFPLWKESTERLARQFIKLGFKAVVVSIDGTKLDQSFVGREYDETFLADLPDEVDPCGEYGAFHTFVYDGPIFQEPVPFIKGAIVAKRYEQKGEDRHNFNDSNLQKKEFPYFYQDIRIPT